MELEEYLGKMKTLKDRKVAIDEYGEKREVSIFTAELGLYDNYSVLLNGSFDKVLEFFKKRSYVIEVLNADFATMTHPRSLGGFDLSTGFERANVGLIDLEPEGEPILKKIKRDYNLTAMIHPYDNSRKMPISGAKACALMAIDLIDCIRINKMPACFPTSMGWKNQLDFAKIVYYEPSQDVRK